MKKFVVDKIIKQDTLGSIEKGIFIDNGIAVTAIKRTYSNAKWWAKPLAQLLAHNEKKALLQLQQLAKQAKPSVPKILYAKKGYIVRSFIDASFLSEIKPTDPNFYIQAKTLIKDMRKLGVCNNDLAKETNWLVAEDGRPVLMDFQLAIRCKKNRKILRLFCREDLRHLLKHKRKYCPKALTAKEKQILETKSLPNQIWGKVLRQPYRWYTRKILRWQRRGGPIDRGAKN